MYRKLDQQFLHELFHKLFENSENISDGTFCVVRYCFASLCYHRNFLTKVLQPSSRIRTSQVFMNIPTEILNMAKVKHYHDAMHCQNAPRLTGISPHVVILNNLGERQL